MKIESTRPIQEEKEGLVTHAIAWYRATYSPTYGRYQFLIDNGFSKDNEDCRSIDSDTALSIKINIPNIVVSVDYKNNVVYVVGYDDEYVLYDLCFTIPERLIDGIGDEYERKQYQEKFINWLDNICGYCENYQEDLHDILYHIYVHKAEKVEDTPQSDPSETLEATDNE